VEVVIDLEPLGKAIAEPAQPPTPLLAVHDMAFAVFQVSVADPPARMVKGETAKLVIATVSPTTGVTVYPGIVLIFRLPVVGEIMMELISELGIDW